MTTLESEDQQVCQALAMIGIEVQSIYDLVNTKDDYAQAVPILLEWLSKAQHDRIKEGVARALTFKKAGTKAARTLVDEFERYDADTPSKEGTKWAISNAISEAADSTMTGDLSRLLLEKKHGMARQMLAIALGRIARRDPARRERALEVLLSLLDDPIVQGHAVIGLRHLNDERARTALEDLVDHEKAWIRKEAKHALAKLDRAAGKQ